MLVLLSAVCLLVSACSGGHAAPTSTTHRLAAGLGGVGVQPRAASAWPQAGYDARSTDLSTGPAVLGDGLGPGGQLPRKHTFGALVLSPASAGHDREDGVRPDGRVAWSLDVGDDTCSSAVDPTNGFTYFGDNTGRLRVVDTRSGHVAHLVTLLGNGKEKLWTSAAVDARGDFWWATTAGHVHGYDRHARQVFRLDVDAGVNSSPAIGGGGTPYLGTTNGTVHAIGRP